MNGEIVCKNTLWCTNKALVIDLDKHLDEGMKAIPR